MKRHMVVALIALNIATIFAAPQNNAAVELSEQESSSVVGANSKGATGGAKLNEFQSDDAFARICTAEKGCSMMTVGDAKGLRYDSIIDVFPVKGDPALTKALSPSVNVVMESVKQLEEQKARLEKLHAEMNALNSMFSKGNTIASNTQALYAASMSKGVQLPAAPATKAFAAALPPSKGAYAASPLKGSSAASMQMEAAMCPMMMYELGKSQKLYAETNSQLQSCNVRSSILMQEKSACENAKAVCEMGKMKAEQQAAYNAKVAAEQKARADNLEYQLARAQQENAALRQQKAVLEETLSVTQDALALEKERSAALTVALQQCNEDKAQLQAEKAVLIQDLADTRETLRETQRALAKEQFEHQRTQRELEATIVERDAIEAARKQLEEAKQQLEDELAETKNQLEAMTDERDQLQVTLDATSARLAKCTEEKLECNSDLAQEKALTALLSKQLEDAMALLAQEKKAREDLTALLMQVKATAESLQKEVEKLQVENLFLREQLMKLKSEQEVALALAAGCPPTYEKFGGSCYKYVREKTQWKMAQEQCMKDGGNLVSIESGMEQKFVVDYLKRYEARYDDKYLHIGGFDYNANGVFKWLSNQAPLTLGQTFWLDSNPRGMGRRCLALQTWNMEVFGQWADGYCWTTLPFVCEISTYP